MTDEPREPDDLTEFLAPRPVQESPGLREAVLHRTQRCVTFRWWARRAGISAGIAAVFLLGIGVGVWQSPRERETVLVPTPVPQVEVVTVTVAVPVLLHPSAKPPSPTPTRTAEALELEAEQADDAQQATRLYREAGDSFLNNDQDYVNAARCYRLYLIRRGEDALTPEAGDSWLLLSVKNSAFKEKLNAMRTNR